MGFGVPFPQVDRGTFSRFQAAIDPAWIVEALTATGTATMRRRRFPAEQVVWLVVGMALFRDIPIIDVVRDLALVLPGTGVGRIAASAVMQAKARLGPSPLRWLFEKCADLWAKRSADRTLETRVEPRIRDMIRRLHRQLGIPAASSTTRGGGGLCPQGGRQWKRSSRGAACAALLSNSR